MITNEMGKPIKESLGEIDKSVSIIDYYNKTAEQFLEEETIPSRFKHALVVSQPWGPTLSKIRKLKLFIDILPWNFPIWLPFKIGFPALVSGCPVLLKHAISVPQCAIAVEELFRDAYAHLN